MYIHKNLCLFIFQPTYQLTKLADVIFSQLLCDTVVIVACCKLENSFSNSIATVFASSCNCLQLLFLSATTAKLYNVGYFSSVVDANSTVNDSERLG